MDFFPGISLDIVDYSRITLPPGIAESAGSSFRLSASAACRQPSSGAIRSLGALAGRGEEHSGRPDTVLKVPLRDPGAVEAESFAVLEQPQRAFKS